MKLIQALFNKLKLKGDDKETYPWLGIDNNATVVFFYKKNSGVVIKSSDSFHLGYHSDNWNYEDFNVLKGEIVLRSS